MKLTDLDARFLKYEGDGVHREHPTLDGADGVCYQCPVCAAGKATGEEGGKRFVVGAHYVICWFTGRVPDTLGPKPGRWNPAGTGLDDLTFVPPGLVSVLLKGGCNAHFHVSDGSAG